MSSQRAHRAPRWSGRAGNSSRVLAFAALATLVACLLVGLLWKVQRMAGLDRSADAALWVASQTHTHAVVCAPVDATHQACSATASNGSRWSRILVYNGHSWNFG